MKLYQETDGAEGHIWNGVPTLLLTTTGRKSGKPYTTPLIYGKDGDQYLIVASRASANTHPQWYLNLEAEAKVGLKVLAGIRRVPGPDQTRNTSGTPGIDVIAI